MLLTDLKTIGIPSLVVGPIPSNFLDPRSAIFLGRSFSTSDSLIYSFLIEYTLIYKEEKINIEIEVIYHHKGTTYCYVYKKNNELH